MKLPVIDFDSITQRKLEELMKAYRECGGKESDIGLVESAGAFVRAAVKVGLIVFDVDNAKPHDVIEINDSISRYLREVMTVPKN